MAADKEEVITPEEAEVNTIFAEYDAKISEIESRLQATKEPRLKPDYRPSWAKNDFSPKGETEAALKKQISVLEREAKGKAAEVAAQCEPALQGKLYEKADDYRNPDNKVQREENKTLDQSGSFLERLRERGKFGRQQEAFDKTKAVAGKEFAETKQDATVQPSNYYSRLHLSAKEAPDAPEPAKQNLSIERDRD